jgi:hypothetical protein
MIHVLLPIQYLPRTEGRLDGPQRRLMVAVLQTAIDDCQGTATARALGLPVKGRSRATREAIAFFESRDRTWPYSFVNICEEIGLDADALRRTISKSIVEIG